MTLLVSSAALAQTELAASDPVASGVAPLLGAPNWPVYVIPGEPQVSTLYHNGRQILVDTGQWWRFMCGSDTTGLTVDDLKRIAENHMAAMAEGPLITIDNGGDGTGFDIVFYAYGSVPSAAVTALGLVEAYLEGVFSDPITVRITVEFKSLPYGVIGVASCNYLSTNYSNSRSGLVYGMDGDDVIQTWLPTGSTVPVRFNGYSSTVTNTRFICWSYANYNATVGSIGGYAAHLTFSTNMPFDYDPSNGVSGGRVSFVDVAIHETGHALGFLSAADSQSTTYIYALDLFRFQRTDGSGNYNPDTYQQFQTTPRLVDYNVPNDDHNSDLIVAEYRMSDGNPYQSSHFREQSYPWIGLMDPAFYAGETHYPDYFSSADKNMFDAVGYDYPPNPGPTFSKQPENQIGCVGGNVQMSVEVNLPTATFQWRRGTANLVNSSHISGATTKTLTIIGVTLADAGTDYNCVAKNPSTGGSTTSNNARVDVYDPVEFWQHPSSQIADPGSFVQFTVFSGGSNPRTWQWRKDGVPLINGGHISGATTFRLTLDPVSLLDAGVYDVVVSNICGPVTSNPATLTITSATNPGDLNCDGKVNFDDIEPFVLALSGQAAYQAQYPNCNWYNADCNGDGKVNFDDIDPFVSLIGG